MSGLPAVLALDGGNSKTDALLVAADGSVLATARGPGTTGAADLDATLAVLDGLTTQVRLQGGRAKGPVAAHLSAALANADLPEEEEQMAAALADQGWCTTVTVVNDTFAVLRAGLVTPGLVCGVAVTCGAGINCVGVAPDGRTTRFLALGAITGDWGGGYGLGYAALWWAMRAEDGRGPETALRGAVAAHFGCASVTEVAVGIHQGTIGRHALAGLAPVVLAVASEGDQVAGDLLHRQAAEIATMAVTAMRRLGLDGPGTPDVPLVLGGGLLSARDPLLTAAIAAELAERAPRAQVSIVDVPPVAGAALLGLDQLGAGADAEGRLRAAYARAAPVPAEGSPR